MQKIVKGLNGNCKNRRAEYRDLCLKYGKENVKRIDNPEAKCKNTRVEIMVPDGEQVCKKPSIKKDQNQ